jgi:hypothetical protein
MRKRLKKKKRKNKTPDIIMETDFYKQFLRDFLSLCEKDEQITTIVDTDMIEPEKVDNHPKGWE